MKSIKTIALLLSISLIFSSCLKDVFCVEGRGDLQTETFVLEEFSGVDLQENATVTIKQGNTQEVIVTGRENVLDKLQTEVRGGVWEIDLGRQCFQDLELDIEITLPNLDEVHVSGSGSIEVGDFENGSDLEMTISGSGDIELGSFTGTEKVEIKVSGSGTIEAMDNFPDLQEMNINISGSGQFDGFDMATNELDARISGSGDIYATVVEKLTIRITGSGDLHYKGNPLIDANITGSGEIINEN